MTWNHRVVKWKDEQWFAICEVFYNKGGEVIAHTDAIDVSGESIEELRETLKRMLECLDKPAIDDMFRE